MKATYELKPYQQALFDKMQAGGFEHGELAIFSAGRQTGKSMYYSYNAQKMRNTKFSITAKMFCWPLPKHLKVFFWGFLKD